MFKKILATILAVVSSLKKEKNQIKNIEIKKCTENKPLQVKIF